MYIGRHQEVADNSALSFLLHSFNLNRPAPSRAVRGMCCYLKTWEAGKVSNGDATWSE
jgi:hypothetical protein